MKKHVTPCVTSPIFLLTLYVKDANRTIAAQTSFGFAVSDEL